MTSSSHSLRYISVRGWAGYVPGSVRTGTAGKTFPSSKPGRADGYRSSRSNRAPRVLSGWHAAPGNDERQRHGAIYRRKNIYPYSVQAYTETSVCLHDLKTIRSFLDENPKFSTQLLKQLSDESIFWYDRTACLTLKQLHGRFADLLLCLSLRIYRKKKFKVPISKKEMAAVTNMSQESLSRVIKDFVGDRLVEIKGNEISILDYEKIRHLSMVG